MPEIDMSRWGPVWRNPADDLDPMQANTCLPAMQQVTVMVAYWFIHLTTAWSCKQLQQQLPCRWTVLQT